MTACSKGKCKDPATVILDRNGRPYCRPHGLALAHRIPKSTIRPLEERDDR